MKLLTQQIAFATVSFICVTLWLWHYYGIPVMRFTNDGYNDVQPGPPFPRPAPNRSQIVHPNIQPAATPIPGTGRPPAI